MALTNFKIQSAKPGIAVKKLSDGNGLQLWVTPAGGKVWKLAYRFDGKQKTLTLALGPFPVASLDDARQKAREARALLVDGVDPAQQKRIDKLVATNRRTITFNSVAAELLAKQRQEGKSPATLEKKEWLYRLASPFIGERPIAEISSAEVLAALRSVEARGRLETAAKLRGSIGEVFRYAISTARAANDPSVALRGALTSPKVTHRAAITNAKALGGLLRAIDGFEGQGGTKACLQLMALLFPRPGELRLAQWAEFDLEAGVWTIPANRTKMRREHRVPLPRQALSILNGLKPLTGHAALVFPGQRTVTRPISENTMNAALRRMGFAQSEMSPHGFRAAASTLLNESGKFSADAIERALAHQDADAIRRAYARGEHWAERLEMAQWWADYLDTLRTGAEIVPLRRGA